MQPVIGRKNPIRWLYRLIFGCLFLILATLLVASANGVMYNPKTKSFETTGIIALLTTDPPYTLIVDGVKTKTGKKEKKITNLFTGLHSVVLEKEGYYSWSTIDNVRPGFTTIHNGIRLFLQDSQPVAASQDQINALQNQVLEIETDLDIRSNEIWAKPLVAVYPITLYGDQLELIARYSQPVIGAQWFPGKNQILLQLGNEIRVIDRDGGNDTVLVELASPDPTDFMVLDNGRDLIYLDQDRYSIRHLY